MKQLLYAVLLFTVGQSMIWFQTNAQFFWKWAKDHPFLMAILFSTPISVMFIKATALIVNHKTTVSLLLSLTLLLIQILWK